MGTSETSGYTPGRLQILKPVLKEWLALIEDADTMHWPKDDAPWWYNERALLSLFAGAIWKCEGWALEEFTTGKSKAVRWRPQGRTGIGRGDIRFTLGGASARQHFQAEAKLSTQSLSRTVQDVKQGMVDRLAEVRKDVLKLLPVPDCQQLAIVFVAPYLAAGRRHVYDTRIPELVALLHRADHQARAWAFPEKGRGLDGEDGYFYPGVAVVIERVARSGRTLPGGGF